MLIKNQTRADATISADIFDMEASPGATTAFDYVEIGEAPRGAGVWVEPDLDARPGGELALRAGTEASIRLTITVPDDAGAGGHYAALRVTGRETRGDSQLQGEIEVHTPILISIAGEAERELRVTIRPGDQLRFRGGRATWRVELRNEGDVHEVFGGRIIVGGALSGQHRIRLRPGILLPGERRVLNVPDEVREAPDRITAKLTIAREDGRSIRAPAPAVLVLPWWLLLVALAAVTLITARVRSRRRAWREYRESLANTSDDERDSPAG